MFSDLTLIDYLFLLIICISTLMGLIRGFVRETLSLITWGFAVWATFAFYDRLNDLLSIYISNDALCLGVSIVGVFLVALAFGITVSYLINKLMAKSSLSGTDRIVGILFGAGRGLVLVTLVMLGGALTPIAQSQSWDHSVLIARLQPVADWLTDSVPGYMEAKGNAQLATSKDNTNDAVDDYSGKTVDYSDDYYS